MEAAPVPAEVKACCAALYAADWVPLLLGDALHPGGLDLTEQLGTLLDLRSGTRVLDVAAGRGSSAVRLATRFGCTVLGVDYGAENVAAARAAAERAGVADRVRFVRGDAEALAVPDRAFDAVLCECALCTFPDKPAAAAELARVLRPGGRLALSDVTRDGPLPAELDGLLARVACLADAQPVAAYVRLLRNAGFAIDLVEPRDAALLALIDQVRARLLASQLAVGLQGLTLPGIDLADAQRVARSAAEAARTGRLGYVVILAMR